MFPGKLEHGGHPITKGVRYIIVLFMGYASNGMTNREEGYVLQKYNELTGSKMGGSRIAKDEL